MVAFFGKIDFYENSRAFRRGWRDGSLWDTTVMRLSFCLTSGSQGSKTDEMNMIWIYGKVLETRHFFLFHFLSTIPSKPAHLRSFLWCFFWFCDQVAHDPFMLIWMQSTWEVCRKTYIYIYIYISIISAIGSFDSHNRCVWDRNGPNQQAQRWATVSNATNDFQLTRWHADPTPRKIRCHWGAIPNKFAVYCPMFDKLGSVHVFGFISGLTCFTLVTC